MSWSDPLARVTLSDGRKLIGASFRGAPFLVETSERVGGRRLATHEFPGRDDPWRDDLGRKARLFHVEGYVLGDDCLVQRDALLAALEDGAGPGELVHPYFGLKRAICDSVTVRESSGEGRIVRFAIDFAEAPVQAVTPTASPDSTGLLSISADDANAANDGGLQATYDPAGQPDWALQSAEAAITKAATAVRDKLAPIVSDTQELAQLNARLTVLTDEVADLVRTPAAILSAFLGMLQNVAATVGEAPDKVLGAFMDAYGADLGDAPALTTATRETEAANLAALQTALRLALAIEAARIAPTITFASLEDAVAMRDQVADALDEQAAAASDDAFAALQELRANLLRAVPGDAALARQTVIERPVATPSILLAYQVYGDTGEELDLVARNDIADPAFCSGALTVLVDA